MEEYTFQSYHADINIITVYTHNEKYKLFIRISKTNTFFIRKI